MAKIFKDYAADLLRDLGASRDRILAGAGAPTRAGNRCCGGRRRWSGRFSDVPQPLCRRLVGGVVRQAHLGACGVSGMPDQQLAQRCVTKVKSLLAPDSFDLKQSGISLEGHRKRHDLSRRVTVNAWEARPRSAVHLLRVTGAS